MIGSARCEAKKGLNKEEQNRAQMSRDRNDRFGRSRGTGREMSGGGGRGGYGGGGYGGGYQQQYGGYQQYPGQAAGYGGEYGQGGQFFVAIVTFKCLADSPGNSQYLNSKILLVESQFCFS